jgi:methylsterol monooxygenase/4-alpha-methyl-delta7-sterol-4alpha-methyl oxidase
MMKKTIALVLFNNWIVSPIVQFGYIWMVNYDIKVNFRDDKIPGPIELICQITFCMICEDICFHFAHRFLHMKFIYPYIHKIHHQYVNQICIASEYAHPIEHILANLIPVYAGSIILGNKVHALSLGLWTFIRISESHDTHSGYEFSWSPFRLLPFSTSSTYHDYHHSRNIGNYSSLFTLWDTILGSNVDFFKFIKNKDKLLKKSQIKSKNV